MSVDASPCDASPRYSRDILPILSEHCFTCHGMDKGARKANLRLDTEDGAKSGDRPAIGGGRDASEFFRRRTADDEDRMPPA